MSCSESSQALVRKFLRKPGPSVKGLVWHARAMVKVRYLLLLESVGILRWLNLRIPIAHAQDGARLRVPLLGGAGMQNILMTERWMTGLMRELFAHRPGGTFIDVGVNVGQTLIKLRRLRPEQPYLGLEPNPSCLHYLSELLRLNDFGKARVLPVGLDVATCLRELVYYDAEDAVSSSATLMGECFRPYNQVAGRRIVPLMSFEEATKGVLAEQVGIIKVDVEGAEESVLETLAPTLARTRAPVMLEILPEPDAPANEAKNQRLAALTARVDYRMYRVMKQREEYTGLQLISDIGANLDVDGWDYALLPAEMNLQTSQPFA